MFEGSLGHLSWVALCVRCFRTTSSHPSPSRFTLTGGCGRPFADFLLWISWMDTFTFWFSYGKIRCLGKLNYPCRLYPLFKKQKANPRYINVLRNCWMMDVFPFWWSCA